MCVCVEWGREGYVCVYIGYIQTCTLLAYIGNSMFYATGSVCLNSHCKISTQTDIFPEDTCGDLLPGTLFSLK